MKKLDALAFGIACGVFWAAAVLCLYLGARFFHYGVPFVKLISSCYLGARATLKGSMIAAVWGLIDGFVSGYILASLYNMFSSEK